jgi:hypothetical protein
MAWPHHQSAWGWYHAFTISPHWSQDLWPTDCGMPCGPGIWRALRHTGKSGSEDKLRITGGAAG